MAVKITIIGMDGLGQSLALALKNSRSELKIVAHDRTRQRMREAKQAGVAHHVDWNLINAIDGASLIFINEPIHQIRETLEIIGSELQNEVVVTDTSSYKAQVMAWATELLPEKVYFVGSTPLVSTQTLNATLFEQQRYALIPPPDTPEAAVRLLSNAISLMGAKPLFMDVAEHDGLMVAVKQLPIMTSIALLNLSTKGNAWREMAVMSDTPYHHATTLPSTDPKTLSTLLRYSHKPLLTWLDALQKELERVRTLISEEDEGAKLEAHLTSLMEAQQRWYKERKGSLQQEEVSKQMAEIKEDGDFMNFLFGSWRKKR
ncbi:MAG: prephenate dehydrogenase [Ardenticatenaceae bacterium]